MNTRTLFVTAILPFVGAVTAHAGVELHKEHTFAAAPGQRVVVKASIHEVDITVASGNTVRVTVDLESKSSSNKVNNQINELAPKFTEEGRDLIIRSTRKDTSWGGWPSKIKGRIAIVMPPDIDVAITASSGSISISGDLGGGAIDCNVSSGGLTMTGAARVFDGNISSGSIEIEVTRPFETFAANASSGNISLRGGATSARANTSSGNITLADLHGNAKMNASSGNITAEWNAIGTAGTVQADASSGDVTLVLPAGIRLAGQAKTSSGSIKSDFQGTFEAKQITFDGGPGAVEIGVGTSSGTVKILAN